VRRAYVKWFREFAVRVWKFDPSFAADVADRSLREQDHYFKMFEAGWMAHKAKVGE
jgi:hypothetical protein